VRDSHAPLKFWRAKDVQHSARFRTTSDFNREYTATHQVIDKRIAALSTTISPTFEEKIGELSSANYRAYAVNATHPNWTFKEGYISALRGCCPIIFTHGRERQRLANPHLTGYGVATIFKNENSKIWLKFSILAVVTLGPRGITSLNFST